MLIIEILFWVFVYAIFHSYMFFPFILSILAKFKKDENDFYEDDIKLPTVSILIAAYNEQDIISKKMNSLLAAKYPPEKIQILIGSDASTDKTNEILLKYSADHSFISFVPFVERTGKTQIINQLVTMATGEVLFFTDANVIFKPDTIYQNVKHYKKPEIGLVGSTIINPELSEGIAIQEKKYVDRENRIKYLEGKLFGATIAPFGGAFSIRKELYEVVPKNSMVDDFYIATKVLEKRKHAVIALDSVCMEDVPTEIEQEFKRKVRISTGNFQNLARFSHLLWPIWNPVAFCFFSHKVLRWLSPFFILFAFIFSAILALQSNLYYLILLSQAGLIAMSFADIFLQKMGLQLKLIRFVRYFYTMNIALLIGFFNYLRGVEKGIWEPTKRNL